MASGTIRRRWTMALGGGGGAAHYLGGALEDRVGFTARSHVARTVPAQVIRLVGQVPTTTHLGLQGPEVAVRLLVLQPIVQQTLVHRVPLALLHLQQVVDQVDG